MSRTVAWASSITYRNHPPRRPAPMSAAQKRGSPRTDLSPCTVSNAIPLVDKTFSSPRTSQKRRQATRADVIWEIFAVG
jgi:hypothetical protein